MNAVIHSRSSNETPARMGTKEIADLCEKDHKNVIRDTRVMLEALRDGSDLSHVEELKDSRGYTAEFLLPKDLTLTLVSGYDIRLRHRIVQRLAEYERGPSAVMPLIPQTLPEALRLAADLADDLEAEKAKIAMMAPKVEAFDLIAASEGSLTFTQAAKVIGIKRDALTRWMHAEGWVYRQNESWVAYQQHIQNGRLEYKEANYTDQKTGMKVSKPYCHITQKGLAKLAVAFGGETKAAA